jgi:hypothetical protein
MEIKSLKLFHKFFNDITSGKKTSTIREGHRDIALGRLILQATEDERFSIEVNVTKVTHTDLSHLSKQEVQTEGFASLTDLVKELHQIYVVKLQRFESLTLTHPVTVITFTYKERSGKTSLNFWTKKN